MRMSTSASSTTLFPQFASNFATLLLLLAAASATTLLLSAPSCLAFSAAAPAFAGVAAPSRLSSNTAIRSTPSSSSSDASSSSSLSTEATDDSPARPSSSTPATYVRCGRCETVYALTEDDLGARHSRGRRLECGVCQHSWFQSKDRLLTLKDGFEMIPLPQVDLDRIESNIKEGKKPKFTGDCKLYVGNIAFECHEDDIKEIFGRVGDVGEVSLVRDNEGKNRGFGFVTMRTMDDGERAISELDGTPVRGRKIAVRESNS